VRALSLALALCASACIEVIQHVPDGGCLADSDCSCGHDCSVAGVEGFDFCGTRRGHPCMQDMECHAFGLVHCVQVMRNGHACGYGICQP
jgi:hypothetical protein